MTMDLEAPFRLMADSFTLQAIDRKIQSAGTVLQVLTTSVMKLVSFAAFPPQSLVQLF